MVISILKIRRSYLYYRNPYTDKTFLYWDGLQETIHQKDIRAELIVSFVYQTANFHYNFSIGVFVGIGLKQLYSCVC